MWDLGYLSYLTHENLPPAPEGEQLEAAHGAQKTGALERLFGAILVCFKVAQSFPRSGNSKQSANVTDSVQPGTGSVGHHSLTIWVV
jgi:hypothetical protein